MSKMTDKDIIKALECCIKPTSDCDNCPLYVRGDGDCFDISKQGALDLINRQQHQLDNYSHNVRTMTKDVLKYQKTIQEQQADIENLERVISYLEGVCESTPDKVRAEALEEFADRLKATPMRFSVKYVKYYDKPPIEKMVLFIDDNDINNLVKEMVGEGK